MIWVVVLCEQAFEGLAGFVSQIHVLLMSDPEDLNDSLIGVDVGVARIVDVP